MPVLLLACALSFVALAACVPEPEPTQEELPFEPAGPDAAPDPAVFGPFPVGVRTVELYDDTRVAPGSEDEPRKLVTEIWYPASQEAVGQAGVEYDLWTYLPEDVQATIPRDALGVLQTIAVRDAPVQPDREPFPLIVFSHGKGGIRMQSTFYTVLLASHGYVVASPDHQGDTIVELVREGDVEISSTTESFLDRPLDVHYLIRHFGNLPDDDPLAGRVDADNVGVTGHSFGALTSFRVAGENSRVRAMVAQAPVGIGLVNLGLEVPVADFSIPTQIQAAGQDETLPADLHAESLWEDMPSPAYYLMLQSAGHFTYSDLCVFDIDAIDAALPDLDARKVLEDGCGPTQIQPDEAFPIINHFAVGFFNTWLRDSAGSDDLLTDDEAHRLAPDDGSLQRR